MFKQELRETINVLLNSLEDFKTSPVSNISDENLRKNLEEIKEEVVKGINKISKDVKVLLEQAEWESLNIAFFGETNAGKSTLIEALIRGDGRSIGDGRKDFTKKISKKSLGNITFLDMPGLEGNESKVLHEIKKAVNESHVVFYVIGTNKEPEETTLQKVKKFLNKKAKVYSIINIRGKPSVYKYVKELVDNNIKQMENRVKNKLQLIFNGHYCGNINLNALIGFLAVGEPIREDLQKDQEKLKQIFGSFEKAYEFSNLHILEQIIEDICHHSLEEMKVSNTYKFLNSLGTMLRNVLRNKKEFDKRVNEINNLAKNYQQEIVNIYLKYQNYIKDLCSTLLKKMEIEMREEVYVGIENGWSEKEINRRLENLQKRYKNEIRNKMNELLEDMKSEVETKIKEFEKRLDLYIKLGKFKGEINLKEIIKKLKIDFPYIFKQIMDVGMSILGIISTWVIDPILGIITAFIAFIKKIWDWLFGDPEKRKRKAKQKAYQEIKKSIEVMKKEINKKLELEFRKLRRKTQEPIKLLEKRSKDLKNISKHIDEIIRLIKKTQTKISTLLVREIVNKDIEYAYIDLDLSSMLIIGINEIPEDKLKLFRIKNIEIFSSMQECFYYIECEVEKEIIYVKNEFFYRALDAINLAIENSQYKFRKWR